MQSVQLLKTTLQIIQLQTSHPVERSGRRSYFVESSATKKPSCREFSCQQITLQRVQLYEQTTLQRDQLEEVTLQRVQLQRNHHVESSAANKSPCREFSYKQISLYKDQLEEVTLQRVQLLRNHSVKSSAANKSPVQNSTTNKSSCREISQKKLPCRQFRYKHFTLQRDQLEEVTLQSVQLQRNHHVESSVINIRIIYIIFVHLLIKSEIFKVFNICFIFSSSCGKEKKIGFKSPKAGHRPALGYTNTKRSEI